MATETILQHWILTRFAFPFLLVFFLVFAILEKTKLLGEDKKQLNALVSFVIGLIFVAFAYPTEVVGNMILFLTVALVVMFVALLLWGFVSGGDLKSNILDNKAVKWIVGIAVMVSVAIAVFWATGFENKVFDFLFKQTWSSTLWTNVLFIVIIAVAIAVVLKSKSD